MGNQTCRKCESSKPLSEFYYRKESGKHRTACKACVRSDRRAYRQTSRWQNWVKLYNQRAAAAIRRDRNNYRKRNPAKNLAHRKVELAIRRGELPKARHYPCVGCGNVGPQNVWHHESYAEEDWLRVTCMCRKCHVAHHSGGGQG